MMSAMGREPGCQRPTAPSPRGSRVVAPLAALRLDQRLNRSSGSEDRRTTRAYLSFCAY